LKSKGEALVKTDSTPATAASTELVVEIESFRAFERNTLKGFCVLVFPSIGLKLFECAVHEREDGKRWIGFPAKSYEKAGKKEWFRLADTTNRVAYARIQAAAFRALDAFLRKESATPPAASPAATATRSKNADSGLPF
jgi:hypothetical protein